MRQKLAVFFFFATCANENVISDVVLLGRIFMG